MFSPMVLPLTEGNIYFFAIECCFYDFAMLTVHMGTFSSSGVLRGGGGYRCLLHKGGSSVNGCLWAWRGQGKIKIVYIDLVLSSDSPVRI